MLVLFGLLNVAQATENVSHCTEGETVYFSCSVKGGKWVSVCGRGLGTPQAMLQYRFGKPTQIEMTFPDQSVVGLTGFTSSLYIRPMPLATTVAEFYFMNNGWTYTVYSRDYCEQEDCSSTQGIQVSNEKKKIDIPCVQKPIVNSLMVLTDYLPSVDE